MKAKKFLKQIMAAILLLALAASGTTGGMAYAPMTAKAEGAEGPEELTFGKQYLEVSSYDVNQYSFNLAQSGGIVTVHFKVDTPANAMNFFYCKIYDNSGNLVGKESCGRGGGEETLVSYLSAGEYTMKFSTDMDSPIAPSACIYTFDAAFDALQETETEYYISNNDTKFNATKINLSGTYQFLHADNEYEDVFKFEVSKGGIYTIAFSKCVKGLEIVLEDSFESIKYTESDVSAGKGYQFVLAKGNYYLTLHSSKESGMNHFKTSYSYLSGSAVKKVKNSAKKTISLSWERNENVEGYQVQISTDGNFSQNKKSYFYAKAVGVAKIRNKMLKKNATVYVRIRTYAVAGSDTKIFSSWSAVKTVNIKNA